MATEDNEQNPFIRPGFIIAAVVVALIVVLGIVVGVVNATRSEPDPGPSSSPPLADKSAAPTTDSSAAEGGASVCGLDGEVLSGSLSIAPKAEWEYQDVYAYPVSSEAGPAETASEGYRFCFQHSPEGALFAAANATVTSFSSELRTAWLQYALSEGQYRQELLMSADSDNNPDVRASIVGFRVLAYHGDTARIDVAFEGISGGEAVTGSVVYELIWVDGDWKLDASKPEPARIAQLPDTAGYISWGKE
ncbi:hypothetical protein [Paenarthrobacter ureafaciens]|uniref:hypothetical protein n=1 Tax=Paenarthrobacter ureafaciens TaxID=37931 RepID=UPI0034643C15